jgi:hypothetical protein
MKKNIIAAWFLSVAMGVALFTFQPVMAASSCSSDSGFLGLPTWYRGLTDGGSCSLKSPSDFNGVSGGNGLSYYIWHIVLNVIDIIARLVVWVTAGFIIYGGFQYVTSSGSQDGVKKAKATITNAIIGLILSLTSVGIINFIIGIWK